MLIYVYVNTISSINAMDFLFSFISVLYKFLLIISFPSLLPFLPLCFLSTLYPSSVLPFFSLSFFSSGPFIHSCTHFCGHSNRSHSFCSTLESSNELKVGLIVCTVAAFRLCLCHQLSSQMPAFSYETKLKGQHFFHSTLIGLHGLLYELEVRRKYS